MLRDLRIYLTPPQEAELTFVSTHEKIKIKIEDISERGAGIITKKRLWKSEEVILDFSTHGYIFHIKGKVLRSKSEIVFVEFQDPEGDDLKIIKDLVETYGNIEAPE